MLKNDSKDITIKNYKYKHMKNIFYVFFFISTLSFAQGKYFGGQGSGYASQTIELETLSVENVSMSVVKIYPNPVSETLFFSKQTETPSEIIDLNGKTILKIKTNVKEIDVSQLAQGTYFFNYKNFKFKFIKK